MIATSRTAQVAQIHKILKKHYKAVVPDGERPVLEHVLFACCLEGARYDVAEGAFASLVEEFFDWNEIRVSSVRELSEVLHNLPDARTAAFRVKRILQHVFEASYSFDLEGLRKKNLGPAAERLRKMEGATEFGVRYVVQSALGGHAIPVDQGALQVAHLLGMIDEKDVEAGVIPGLERAIAKNKGVEFASLLHQLGADFLDNPYSPSVHAVLQEINPEVKSRLPKRQRRKRPAATSEAATTGAAAGEPSKDEGKDAGEKTAKDKTAAQKVRGPRKPGEAERPKPKKAGGEGAEKPIRKPEAAAAKKRPSKPPASKSGAEPGKKRGVSSKLPKRKPR